MEMAHAGASATFGSILIVEDDPLVSGSCSRSVRQLGWETRIAPTVSAALAALNDRHHGLVVDLGLPDGSGFDVVADARQRDPELPVLVWTGTYFDAANTNRAAFLNVSYAHKPTESYILRSFLERCKNPKRSARLRDVVGDFATTHGLTRAHAHVLYAAASGSASRESIAEWLGVGPETVKSQVSEILARVRAKSLEQAVAPLRAEVLRD
jgi:FixJ family two-component response regulator